MQTRAGTFVYMAPEVLDHDYNETCDFWSLGVILYVMLCGYCPFDTERQEQLVDDIKNCRYDFDDPAWNDASADAIDLVKKLMAPESCRITSRSVFKHPFILKHTRINDPVSTKS